MPMVQKQNRDSKQINAHRQRGQTTIFLLVALAIFLLGFIGFGVDITNLFFRRQKAQGAADAACQACAMNMLTYYEGVPTPTMGFTPGTAFNCTGNSTDPPPCKYAALNGYDGSGNATCFPPPAGSTETNFVCFTFPASVPGVTPPDPSLAASPFVTATVVDRAKVYFMNLLNFGVGAGGATRDVGASATCGLIQANAPVPIIVLNPVCPHSFELSGNPIVTIVGGPTKSVQVNSGFIGDPSCAAATQSAANQCRSNGSTPGIDLSKGGPNFTGSSFGVFGASPEQSIMPGGFNPGSTGSWLVPSTPVPDPYALTPGPARPALLGTKTHIPPGGGHGCPDLTDGCTLYTRGLYTQPIVVKGETAIFEPGIYYIEPTAYTAANDGRSATYRSAPGAGCLPSPTGQASADFAVDSNGVVRMSTDVGDGSKGVMFYLSGPGTGPFPYGSVFFGSNAGKSGGRTITPFTTAGMNCDGSSPDPSLGIPGSVNGNVLVGQCTDGGNYLPYDSAGNIRGILFFQDRRNNFPNGQPSMQGGGGLALSGTMYFHNCDSSSATDIGAPCQDFASGDGFQSFFQLQGSPGGGTYVLGNITTDQFVIGGSGTISMQLNTNAVYKILKAVMLQ